MLYIISELDESSEFFRKFRKYTKIEFQTINLNQFDPDNYTDSNDYFVALSNEREGKDLSMKGWLGSYPLENVYMLTYFIGEIYNKCIDTDIKINYKLKEYLEHETQNKAIKVSVIDLSEKFNCSIFEVTKTVSIMDIKFVGDLKSINQKAIFYKDFSMLARDSVDLILSENMIKDTNKYTDNILIYKSTINKSQEFN